MRRATLLAAGQAVSAIPAPRLAAALICRHKVGVLICVCNVSVRVVVYFTHNMYHRMFYTLVCVCACLCIPKLCLSSLICIWLLPCSANTLWICSAVRLVCGCVLYCVHDCQCQCQCLYEINFIRGSSYFEAKCGRVPMHDGPMDACQVNSMKFKNQEGSLPNFVS